MSTMYLFVLCNDDVNIVNISQSVIIHVTDAYLYFYELFKIIFVIQYLGTI